MISLQEMNGRLNQLRKIGTHSLHLFPRMVDYKVMDAIQPGSRIACSICLVDYPTDSMFFVSCGHQICNFCWKDYIEEAINDGAMP
ncbi:putative E3 ubiquitin-protein ligase ARI6 [Spinacia oleracea]|uniref:E3 ubiquitin-protein ligase ARI6 n=1 Tax=Spinacia oleracea TaxID=3562 RepID=A0ABM3QYI6_SPIOL|nr:putative E3 ubiquitin-protein ligase ARI6 [Spinacia oleracea]